MRTETLILWIGVAVAAAVGLAALAGTWALQAADARGEAAIAARLAAVREANPSWPWAVLDAGEIVLGMTEGMVLVALGAPDQQTVTVDADGVRREWTYTPDDARRLGSARREAVDHRAAHAYETVYFIDGIVTGWAR